MRTAAFYGFVVLATLLPVAIGRAPSAKPIREVPDTVSAEAKRYLESMPDPATLPGYPAADDLPGWKRTWDAGEAAAEPSAKATLKRYESKLTERKIGGVPVLEIIPKGWKKSVRVLVHAHGGAYAMFSARSRLSSSALAADATGLRVISIDYTRAPFAKWPQVTDEVLAVIDDLRKEGVSMKDLAVYGESAGGGLVAGSVLKMRDQGLELPAAIVLWSPWADITDRGDSSLTLRSSEPTYLYEKHLKPAADAYADPKDQRHPYVSPVYGDFAKGFPPTLIQGGTREIFLSHFVRLYRAIDGAGGTAVLDLYEGMPHVFQLRPEMADAPETRAALKKMASFLKARFE